MGRLILVRHGQASFLAANYDNLSDLGRRQCRLLGAWWAGHGLQLDRVYIGPKERHRQSAEEAAAAYAEAGLPFPELVLLRELDEFAWGELMQHAKGPLSELDPRFAELQETMQNATDPDDKFRAVQHIIEGVTRLWAEGQIDEPHIEKWDVFVARVERAVDAMIADAGKGGQIAVFTSGGTVSAVARRALELSPLKTLELIWAHRNAAMTEFLYSRDRFSLRCFNEAPHLGTPDLWTWR